MTESSGCPYRFKVFVVTLHFSCHMEVCIVNWLSIALGNSADSLVTAK